METQQMMEILLATIDANTKAMKKMMNKIKDEIKVYMNAIRKADLANTWTLLQIYSYLEYKCVSTRSVPGES
jgi:hypothetical protein